jgi:hypothetical protein
MSTFHRIFNLPTTLITMALLVNISVGMSVPTLAECTIDFLTHHNIINTSKEIPYVSECDAIITTEIDKFYENIQDLILKGVNVDNLEDESFRHHNICIVNMLKEYNVSELYLKGIAYQKLDRVHKSDHFTNQKHTSQQILLMYALQKCDPRSFYHRHHDLFSRNTRATNEQAKCLLNYLNENKVDEPYQFTDNIDSVSNLRDDQCSSYIMTLIKSYYIVLDRARKFSVFNLNPSKAMQCRASYDKNLIDNMILLHIFRRIQFTNEQYEREITRFYEIASESAKNFFQCILMYD